MNIQPLLDALAPWTPVIQTGLGAGLIKLLDWIISLRDEKRKDNTNSADTIAKLYETINKQGDDILEGRQQYKTQQDELAALKLDGVEKDARILKVESQVTLIQNQKDAEIAQIKALLARKDEELVQIRAELHQKNEEIIQIRAEQRYVRTEMERSHARTESALDQYRKLREHYLLVLHERDELVAWAVARGYDLPIEPHPPLSDFKEID